VEVHGKARPSLKIGDYNVPKPGENKLGSIQYEKVRKYTPKGSKRETFWFYIYPEWVDIANEIKVLLFKPNFIFFEKNYALMNYFFACEVFVMTLNIDLCNGFRLRS